MDVKSFKKAALRRGLLGAPIGIAIGHVITIFISLIQGTGEFYAVVPAFVKQAGSEAGAVALQCLLCMLLGAGCAAASVIWENEKLGLTKQTALHFIAISLCMLPIAYMTHWMDHSLGGILSYFGVFALIYVVIWLALYGTILRNVRAINASLRKKQR